MERDARQLGFFGLPEGVCVTTSDFAFSPTENQSLALWKRAKNRVITQTPKGRDKVAGGDAPGKRFVPRPTL